MQRKGVATFTLDGGKAPKWLFNRMVSLGRELVELMIDEFGPDEFIQRIADPVWFQSLGCVLAFDWNASGLTTTLTGALREAIKGRERELGIIICGGKGKTSLKTPQQLQVGGNEYLSLSPQFTNKMVYHSRMTAKIDSGMIQDGFDLYHHVFFLTRNGHWSVVQQGMNKKIKRARRYHWYSGNIKDLVNEPHSGISSQDFLPSVLNLAAEKSKNTRNLSVDMIRAGYLSLNKDLKLLRKYATPVSRMASVRKGSRQLTLLELDPVEFHHHPGVDENFIRSRYFDKVFAKLSYDQPKNYEQLIGTSGVGEKTVRALALIGEVLYGAKPSYQDPARYSFAFGGKDGTPYPVDRRNYDKVIRLIRKAVMRTKMGRQEKEKALVRAERTFGS